MIDLATKELVIKMLATKFIVHLNEARGELRNRTRPIIQVFLLCYFFDSFFGTMQHCNDALQPLYAVQYFRNVK